MEFLKGVGLGGVAAVGRIRLRLRGLVAIFGRVRLGSFASRLRMSVGGMDTGRLAGAASVVTARDLGEALAERTAGRAVTRNRSRLGSLDDIRDGDGTVTLGGSFLAAKVAVTALDSLRDGEDAGGLCASGLSVVHDLGGDADVTGVLSGARGDGVHVCGGDVGSKGTVGGVRSNSLVGRRTVGAGAEGCERGDGLGGDLTDGAVGDAGRASSDGVDHAGDDSGGDGGRRSRVSAAGLAVMGTGAALGVAGNIVIAGSNLGVDGREIVVAAGGLVG